MTHIQRQEVSPTSPTTPWKWPCILAAIVLISGCIYSRPTAPVPPAPLPAAKEWDLPGGGRIRQQLIATFSCPAEVLISDDLAHVAVLEQRGWKQRLVVDGHEGPEYDAAQFPKHDGPALSPSGIPLLYVGANEGRWRLVVNGQPGPECDAWLGQMSCGPDRTDFAYVAVEIARRAFVAIDGQAGLLYDDVSYPVLSPDRQRIVYIACQGRGPERRQFLVMDGREGPQFDAISPDSVAFSTDSRRVACAAKSGAKWRVVVDGQAGPEYDRIGEGPILFLADGTRVAYAALKGGQWRVVRGNQAGGPCDEVADLTSARGGRQVVYAARQGTKWHVDIDGQAGAEYDQIGLIDRDRLWVSPNGETVAYAARLARKWQVVVNGKPGPACDEIRGDSALAPLSPDGKHAAYIARNGAKWSVVLDGQAGVPWEEIGPGSFEFSDDGVRTAYTARRAGKWVMVIDGRAGPEYDQLDASCPVFARGGKRTAYAAKLGETWRVVVDGEEGPPHKDVDELVFSPNGGRIAYVATGADTEEKRSHALGQRVVVDGKAGPVYGRVGAMFDCLPGGHHDTYGRQQVFDRAAALKGKIGRRHGNEHFPAFSADGAHVAYTALDGFLGGYGARVMGDDTLGPKFGSVGPLTFSPDGQHLAYAAIVGQEEKGGASIVIDDQPGPRYDEVDVPNGRDRSCFSPDSKHTAYAARHGAFWCAVVDGKQGPPCDTFLGPESVSHGRSAAFASWRLARWYAKDYRELFQNAPDYGAPGFWPLFFGPGGQRVAYVGIVQTRARAAVVVHGQAGPQYEQVSNPVVSPDGKRVGYIACRGNGQERKFFAVIDGRAGPECDEIPLSGANDWHPFSPDNTRTAYLARIGQAWHVIIDGQIGPEYEKVQPASVGAWGGFFSKDGQRMAYFAKRGGKWRAVVDGREGPEFDEVGNFMALVFSPDSKRVAYMASRSGMWRAVIDGREGPEYDIPWAAGVTFSPDSRRTAYVGGRHGKQFVVLDGREHEPHESVDGIRFHFSPDSQRLAYIAYRDDESSRKAHFVVDGQEEPEYGDHIWEIRFSPDSKHVAYIAINGRWQDSGHTEQLVVDGKEGPVVDKVREDSIGWSADSRRLAYSTESNSPRGPHFVNIDGQFSPGYAWVRNMAFSPDGKHLAYDAYQNWEGGRYIMVRDGAAGRVFDDIEPFGLWPRYDLFTPDSRHLVYQAQKGGKHSIVMDDQRGPEFDSILFSWLSVWAPDGRPSDARAMRTPRMLPDGAVRYPALVAGKSGEVYIITQWPAADAAPSP